MNKEYEALKIGALLHDIGKLLERGGYGETTKFEEYFDKFGFILSEKEKNVIKEIIGMHHCKNIKDNKCHINIVKLADWLSSGERILSEYEIEQKREWQALCSIFEEISLSGEKNVKYDDAWKYNLIELNISKSIFPEKKCLDEEYNYCSDEDYKKLIKKFSNELNNIDNFEKLYQLMHKYTWCMPSSTYWKEKGEYLPDVSLYDHSKTTCAIACCLYKGLNNKIIDENSIINMLQSKEKDKELNKNIFSLIHGDISGVQDFIFNITSKGANKSLKGRSFYLDFLTELCAKYVIQRLDLPITNILFYGGGHFYILSYNIDSERTLNFERTINDILFEKFGADLYVAIGKVDLRPIDFLMDYMDDNKKIGIPYKWKESAEATSKRKMRKFEHKGADLFKPRGKGGHTERCPICREENKILESEGKKCIYCASFEDLTKKLKDFGDELKVGERGRRFEIDEIKKLSVLKDFFEGNMVEFENTTYNLPYENGNLEIPYKIGAMAFPVVEGELRDFSELAEDSEGIKKLAILKMDVDNLGKIITKGLGKKATISRLSTLSSMLTLFFTGYIPYLIKSSDNYKNFIYLTYSGGDDTLIVGAWDKVWDLSKEIREEFNEFVCENEDITLSAGIVLINPKFEYRKGVYLAEEELERAKDNSTQTSNKKEKNSICIFGYPIFWDNINKVNEFEENFKRALENKESKRRILHISQRVFDNLRRVLKVRDDGKGNEEIIVKIPYLWRMKYYLYRNYGKSDGGLEDYVVFIDKYLNEIEERIRECNIDRLKEISFNDIIIASRIAELKSRKRR
ncbi:type III-A CRISPR-associated protein Cas10/Csm1 [Methanothermococcus sp. SCGC AD-155-M21]|nr:type III-A CRISPR-associated protein Cas10/Csm1 [Methanothermococcus sp. SCGC AD-155-M21]